MKLVYRYLLKEYLTTVGYCMAAFSSLFIITDLFGRLSKYIAAQTPRHMIVLLYIFKLAEAWEFLVPACLMLATLYTLWQLTRHNELIAMRSSGISLGYIIAPFITVGLFFSISTMILKETVTPNTSMWVRDFSLSKYDYSKFQENRHVKINDFPYANTRNSRQWRISEFDIQNPAVINGVVIINERPDGTRTEKITADKAEWLDHRWWLHKPLIQKFDTNDNPTGGLLSPAYGPDPIMEFPMLDERPMDFANAAKEPEFLSARNLSRMIRTNRLLPDNKVAQMKVDFHARLAMPWACLITTLFAIPVGARSARQGVLTTVFTAIACLFLFYALIQFGFIMGKTMKLWPWLAAWLSNIIFLSTGLLMIRKIN